MQIDFHSHVLPGIDDGSPDVHTTEALLGEELRQGVEIVVATPHFYAYEVSVDHFIRRRNAALEKAVAKIGGTVIRYKSSGQPKRAVVHIGDQKLALLMGGEIYYFHGMGDAEQTPRLCIEGTDTILVEMPFAQWNQEVVNDIDHLLKRQKLRVVIAHVERYYEFQKDLKYWDQVMTMPVVPQINAGTLIGPSGSGGLFGRAHKEHAHAEKKQRWAFDFIREHPDFIIATDTHNMETRRPNLKAGVEAVREEFGQEEVDRMFAAAAKMLQRE